jgi:hypothetical protein
VWPKGQARVRGYQRTAEGDGSKLERAVRQLLEIREKAGEIQNLRRQVTVVLQDGPRSQRIAWKVDFAWDNPKTGATEYAEAKGFETELYKIKLKLFRGNPAGRLEIWKGTWRDPRCVEVIEPLTDSTQSV